MSKFRTHGFPWRLWGPWCFQPVYHARHARCRVVDPPWPIYHARCIGDSLILEGWSSSFGSIFNTTLLSVHRVRIIPRSTSFREFNLHILHRIGRRKCGGSSGRGGWIGRRGGGNTERVGGRTSVERSTRGGRISPPLVLRYYRPQYFLSVRATNTTVVPS